MLMSMILMCMMRMIMMPLSHLTRNLNRPLTKLRLFDFGRERRAPQTDFRIEALH